MNREQAMTVLSVLALVVLLGASIVGLLGRQEAQPALPAAPQPPASPNPPAAPEQPTEPTPSEKSPPSEALIVPFEPVVPPPATPMIERVDVDGQDLADLMNVLIWKFRYTLEPGRYSAFLWVERWDRDATAPQVTLLASNTVEGEHGDVVLKLPTENDGGLFIRLGKGNISRAASAEPIAPPSPLSWAMLDQQGLVLDTPIHLVTMTHSLAELPRSMLTNAHATHDVTIYVKAGFTRGDSKPFDATRWVRAE